MSPGGVRRVEDCLRGQVEVAGGTATDPRTSLRSLVPRATPEETGRRGRGPVGPDGSGDDDLWPVPRTGEKTFRSDCNVRVGEVTNRKCHTV